MTTGRLSVALLAAVAVSAPALRAQKPQAEGYAILVSPGDVTLQLEPQWQDTALVVVVRGKARSGEMGSIDLRDQVMLMVGLQCYPPDEVTPLEGREGLAWMVFRLPERPASFAISIRDVGEESMRILRWPPAVTTP